MFGPLHNLVVVSFVLTAEAWVSPSHHVQIGARRLQVSSSSSSSVVPAAAAGAVMAEPGVSSTVSADAEELEAKESLLTQDLIAKLPYRELVREVESRDLPSTGTTSQLRTRLREAVLPDEEDECIVNEDGMGDDCLPVRSSDFDCSGASCIMNRMPCNYRLTFSSYSSLPSIYYDSRHWKKSQ